MCKCAVCGNSNYIPSSEKFPKEFCSYRCYEDWTMFNKPSNCECSICKIQFYLKPTRLKRVKNGITCSKKCSNELKAQYYKGEGNHQYGLKGDKNGSFKGKVITNQYGYIMEYCPEHPYCNKDGRVRQHRLVIEKNYTLFNKDCFEIINGINILKKEYDVHHINEIRTDNRIENLIPLTRSEHTTLHNNQKIIIRDELGKITGVLKFCELLESPEEDNQQRS